MEANLYYKQGASDKVYQVQIVEEGDGFLVNFQYGRRGAGLMSGTKTNDPVPEAQALKIFQQLVNSKKAKGYVEVATGVSYQTAAKEDTPASAIVQLLNPVEESDLEELFAAYDFVAQEKYDGKRLTIEKKQKEIIARNRRGLVCGMPTDIANELSELASDFILDGELVGEVFYAFDILSLGRESLINSSFNVRNDALVNLKIDSEHLKTSPTYNTEQAKRNLFQSLERENKEGIVFKNVDAPYTAGRPSRLGSQLKFKLQSEATCEVFALDTAKRSMHLTVRDGDRKVSVGNVQFLLTNQFLMLEIL